MNLFDTNTVAEGYSKDRPYLHPEIIQKVKVKLNLGQKAKYALDVGCGAGLSTLALKDIAENIVGVDSSEAMIQSAIKDDKIEYFNYPAENLPLNRKFDIITLAGVINWVDRPKFFSEAKTILSDEGFVIIYDIYILGIMEDDDKFEQWYQNEYLGKFPIPPRNESPLTNEEAQAYGFIHYGNEKYTSKAKFSLESYKRYMFTQSNITTALKDQRETRVQIEAWFDSSLVPFFDGNENILFGGYIWYLKNNLNRA
jgi:predicted TPR repeat methyltransferase